MSSLENKVFNIINKPNIYLRYADDILLFTIALKKLAQDNRLFKTTLFSISPKKSI